ncbi:MAG: DUF1282 family protein [Phocaeicola sp.]|nr:DUF1282 family protein [Phocaeicola sp.]MBR1720028.1 DUF1282 family protein [Phocaeicola sp.]
MNYKELFRRIGLLISDPDKAWREISVDVNKRNVQMGFVYPMIGFCGISAFIGALLVNTSGPMVFQTAMMKCGGIFISLFAGFFLAVYLVQLVNKHLLNREYADDTIQQFVGYSMVVSFLLIFIDGLFNLSFLYWLLMFYTIYVVYIGARIILDVQEDKLTVYTLVVSFIVACCPIFISFVFNQLSLVLN